MLEFHISKSQFLDLACTNQRIAELIGVLNRRVQKLRKENRRILYLASIKKITLSRMFGDYLEILERCSRFQNNMFYLITGRNRVSMRLIVYIRNQKEAKLVIASRVNWFVERIVFNWVYESTVNSFMQNLSWAVFQIPEYQILSDEY